MKIFTALNPEYLTNIYFITDDDNKNGVIIDPGSFDENVYKLAQYTKVEINKIIVTHDDIVQTKGIPLIKRIYDAEIIAYKDTIMDFKTTKVRDGMTITQGGLTFKIIETQIHSHDSISILIEDAIFTGDIIEAGTLNSFEKDKEPSDYELHVIKNKILTLPANLIIYPSQGPATTLEIEKKYNQYFKKIIDDN
jgi:hydroxyacylglutathione hydrolase